MTISMRNANRANIAGCSISDLNIDNLLDEEIAQNLCHNGAADQPLAVGVFRHPLQIAGGYKEQAQHSCDRKQGENGGCQAPVGAGRFYLSLQTESLADDIC